MKKIHSMLASIAFMILAASCDENFEVADKADSLVSVAINTLNIQKSFNVGDAYQAELWIQRGGLSDITGKVEFVLDSELLDSLNREDRTNYEMLPESCYELTNTDFVLNKNEMCGYITYHPEKIVELSGYDQVKYVLPLRLVSDELRVNPERCASLLAFQVSEPIVQIANSGIINIDPTQTSQMDIQISVPFTNKWDIICDLTHNQSLIEEYNSSNKTSFIPLPDDSYIAPEKISLPEGVNQTTASYQLKDNLLPGNYILPISIGSLEASQDGTPNNSLVIDKESNTLFRIVKEGQKISKADWEIIACNSAAAANPASYLIDDNEATFWHCKTKSESGWCEPPFDMTIDMKKQITIAQIDLVNRGEAGRANNIKWVEFYASNDNSDWKRIGASDFNDEFVRETFRYYVQSTTARYLKLVIPEGYGNACPPAAIRELTVYGY
ncbi:BT_3987 domain-containing protein [uncultured Bacteroides sp.]|uniref:BT_3987 domain-containing protein n=1 Tax=uncultured Bacteroides sp. TaxID=162156 RepID=UPI0025F66CFD|nr:DUF1735 domain-containing protein [uncultured Bacteroides sp.]